MPKFSILKESRLKLVLKGDGNGLKPHMFGGQHCETPPPWVLQRSRTVYMQENMNASNVLAKQIPYMQEKGSYL